MKGFRILAAAALAAASLSAHAVGRLADFAIFDRSTGRELPVHWHEGRPYVVGTPGNEYQVVLRNRRGEDLLAVVSVDGVNVVSGETANTYQGGYVLSPWQRLAIRGWRKSLGEVASFYFTSLGDSYAGRTGRPDHVGVIGVALFQRRAYVPEDSWIAPPAGPYEPKREGDAAESPPAAAAQAPRAERKFARPSSPLGTGHGRRESSNARHVEFERATPYPVETIAIYYDSYRNLVARGILHSPVAPRDPQPFPGFVPDPVARR